MVRTRRRPLGRHSADQDGRVTKTNRYTMTIAPTAIATGRSHSASCVTDETTRRPLRPQPR